MPAREPVSSGSGRQPAPPALRKLQDFLNTKDTLALRDEFRTPTDVTMWFAARDLLSPATPLTERDLQHVLNVREAVRTFLRRSGDDSSHTRDILDDVGRRAGLAWSFDADGGVHLRAQRTGLAGAIGNVLAPLLAAALTGTLTRLKTCPNCGWVFYDYSKNRSGTWCSMNICGSRTKARRYYWRHQKAAVASGPDAG